MTGRPTVFNTVLDRAQREPAEDVIARAKDVQAVVDMPGWTVVQDTLAQMVSDLDLQMENGLHEHVSYAAMVAERRTLRTTQAIADAIIEAGVRAEKSLATMVAQMAAGEGQ